MVAGNANYQGDLLSSTFAIFLDDQPSDAVFGDLVLFDVLGKKSKVTKKGGLKLLESLMISKSSAVGSYSGWDTLDVTPQQPLTNAEFNWKQYYGTVAINSQEELQNQGIAAQVDILKARWDQAKISLADQMDSDMFKDGTGNSSKAVDGLDIMVDSAGTYGNIVRSANTFWQAHETPVGGALAITGSTGMRKMFNDCSLGRGRVTPDFLITTQTGFESFEALMDTNMRYTVQLPKTPVFENLNLMFRNTPLFYDAYCQSGVMYFLNSKYMRLAIMSTRDGGVEKGEDRDRGDFRAEPFQTPVNQDGKVAKFFWMGNMASSNVRFLGKLTGITNA